MLCLLVLNEAPWNLPHKSGQPVKHILHSHRHTATVSDTQPLNVGTDDYNTLHCIQRAIAWLPNWWDRYLGKPVLLSNCEKKLSMAALS